MYSNVITEIILLIYVLTATGFEIPMCCPVGYTLKESSRGVLRARLYECVEHKETPTLPNVLNGYRIKVSEKSEIPSCDNPALLKITGSAELSSSSCIFESNSALYAIICAGGDISAISVLRKCCPLGQAYDLQNKYCVDSYLTNAVYKDLFKHPVVFSNQAFNCQSGVIVEYSSRYHQFNFIDSELHISENQTTYSSESYCLEATFNSSISSEDSQQTFMARTCNSAQICERIPCVRRCCSDREMYFRKNINESSGCVPHPVDHSFDFHKFDPEEVNNDGSLRPIPIIPTEYGILQKQTCKKYPEEEYEHFFHHKDGSIYLPELNQSYGNQHYCVEFFKFHLDDIMRLTFICFDETDENNSKYSIYATGLLISSVFSVITLIVYLSLPKLRNLPGKILICLVFCQLASYLGMAIAQIHPTNACYVFAFFIYFSLIAEFSWLNIMCFDIWITFSSTEGSHRLQRHEERRRFTLYSTYAWGVPILMTTITAVLDQGEILPTHLRPKFGEGRCWFEAINVAPHIIFFLGPAGILIFCNFILFILTLRYCNKVKREIDRMQNTNSKKPVLIKKLRIDKTRFAMNFKLFVVMGVSWMLEIISTISYNKNHDSAWMIVDLYNTLQGVLVFLIFVFKWKVWYLIVAKFSFKGRSKSLKTTTTTIDTVSSTSVNNNLLRMKSTESLSSSMNHKVPIKRTSPFS